MVLSVSACYMPQTSLVSRQGSQWNWDDEHGQAYEKAKRSLKRSPMRAHFDAAAPVELECDSSSQDALGAALIQRGRPVYFASRSSCTAAFAKSTTGHSARSSFVFSRPIRFVVRCRSSHFSQNIAGRLNLPELSVRTGRISHSL